MKGKNTLRLNQATMLEALQLWLGAKFKDIPPKAVQVRELNCDAIFEVEVEEGAEHDLSSVDDNRRMVQPVEHPSKNADVSKCNSNLLGF